MTAIMSEVEIKTTAEAQAASRSEFYRLSASVFCFPTSDSFHSISTGSVWEKLKAIASNLPYKFPVEQVGTIGHDTNFADFQTQFIGTFDVGREGLPPSPLHEGDYAGGRTGNMAELMSFYHYFGLHIPCEQPRELPDYLSIELEFMHFLTFKEAQALSQGKSTASYLSAERDFLERHLLNLVSEIAVRLQPLKVSFFSDMIGLAEIFCRDELAYLNDRVGG